MPDRGLTTSRSPAAEGFVATPGQTIGPFFHFALPFAHDRELVPLGQADAVRLHGFVFDGDGNAVPDALVEIRQADGTGMIPAVPGSLRRRSAPFTGWGRSTTDWTGHYWFNTIEPGPSRPGTAAFIAVIVFARGLLDRLFTRVYVPDNKIALAADPLLSRLGPPARASLIAGREPDGSLRFDIHLQGDDETVFLSFDSQADRDD